MDFADHCVARDTTELGSNLARAQTFRPESSQQFDAFVGPGHPHIPVQGGWTQNPSPSVVLVMNDAERLTMDTKVRRAICRS